MFEGVVFLIKFVLEKIAMHSGLACGYLGFDLFKTNYSEGVIVPAQEL